MGEVANPGSRTNSSVLSSTWCERPEGITVCICTYRRDAIVDAVLSVNSQVKVRGLLAGIIVIDNDETDVLRSKIMGMAPRLSCPIDYVHAPAKNISIARNAAIDAVKTRWLAFLDDDEIATEEWLYNLSAARMSGEIFVGPSVAQYPEGAAGWLQRCDFHSARMDRPSSSAYSGNVMIDLCFLDKVGCRFLTKLGLTGGEDTILFSELALNGARVIYRSDAVVHEIVPLARANMRWVLRRMFRGGQTHGLACKMFDKKRFRALWFTSAVKLLASALMSVVSVPGSDSSRRWFVRAAMHLGVLSYTLNQSILEEYR